MKLDRIDKIVSSVTSLSRSEVRSAVKSGRVSVNGKRVLDCAEKYDMASDNIKLDGIAIRQNRYVYLMMNKPAGYVTSSEEKGQKTVFELLPDEYRHYDMFAAGRLDKDTEGFLLLTNDGDFCHRVISPKTDTVKCYFLKAEDILTAEDVEALADGLVLKDGTVCRSAGLEIAGEGREAYIYITEGKYHEVKRLIAARGNKVTYLKRVSIAGVMLDEKLQFGACRELTEPEIHKILNE